MSKYIVTGDNHLRFDAPICRLDEDWMDFQRRVLNNIVDMANTHEADIVCTGDLFDSYAVHSVVVSMFIDAISVLDGNCHIIAGNHALKYHRESLAHESSIGIIKAIAGDNTGKIRYYSCNEETIDGRFEHSYRLNDDITLVHTLTFPTEDEVPFKLKAATADYLLDKYDTPWIFIGDMHHNFVVERDNRFVINPGCMTIQTADMLDYIPGVYYIDTGVKVDVTTQKDAVPQYRISDPTIVFAPVLNDPTMVTRNHLEKNKMIDERLSAFVETINTGKELHLSFKDNLNLALQQITTTDEMRTLLHELEEGI